MNKRELELLGIRHEIAMLRSEIEENRALRCKKCGELFLKREGGGAIVSYNPAYAFIITEHDVPANICPKCLPEIQQI